MRKHANPEEAITPRLSAIVCSVISSMHLDRKVQTAYSKPLAKMSTSVRLNSRPSEFLPGSTSIT